MTNKDDKEVECFFPPCNEKWRDIAKEMSGVQSPDGVVTVVNLKEKDIPIEKFFQAVELLACFYDRMGMVFEKIKSELLGNIAKARDHIPAGVTTMRAGFEYEKKAGSWKKDPGFCVGCYWMMNSLRFLVETLRNLRKDKSVSVGKCVKDSYSQTLMKHHGFVLRAMFKTLLSAAVPGRADLESKLAKNENELEKGLDVFLALATPYLDFCEGNNPHNEGK